MTPGPDAGVTDDNVALLTDQYELTMAQAYWREEMNHDAVFSLFVRRLPEERSFLMACGLDTVLEYLERFRFSESSLAYLRGRPELDHTFLDWLASLRFTGEVRAVPEGTVVFANEPILEIRAPLPQAQLVETFIMNQIHLQTVLASKAARVVLAAAGRPVVDFGLRRMHGTDAGLKAVRAFHVAGVAGTSNVLAGQVYGVPVTGTMAHSYIQAHDSELDAFRAFTQEFPETVLLVDSYDTLSGVRNVTRLAGELGDAFRVRAIRLDSGDLRTLALQARQILDDAGLSRVQIFASGGLDEWAIARLLTDGAPIDGFGVGTGMGVSSDAPALDLAYKLTDYAGRGRLKLSTAKPVLPGPKQLFREDDGGTFLRDTIARADEALPGQPLLQVAMRDGRRTEVGSVAPGPRGTPDSRGARDSRGAPDSRRSPGSAGSPGSPGSRDALEEARSRAAAQLRALPQRLRVLSPAAPPYPVAVSPALQSLQDQVSDRVREEQGGSVNYGETNTSSDP